MCGGGSAPSTPPPPPLPPPPPPAPTRVDPAVVAARATARKAGATAGNRDATIMTAGGGQGLDDSSLTSTGKKTLLGT